MLTLPEVLARLREACAAAGGQNRWARENGLQYQYVSNVLHGRKPPSDRVLKPLGLRRVEGFEEVGGDHDPAP